jgi:hypothetical protein
MRMKKVFSAASWLIRKASIAACASHIGQKPLGARAEIGSAESRLVTRFSESTKLLLIVLTIVAAGLWSCGGGSGGNPINPAFTGACAQLPPPSAPEFTKRFNEFVMQKCYEKQQWKHDANRRTSEGLHAPFVKLWYSPLLFNWMTVSKRKGPIPDGAIVIKEEFLDLTSPIAFWSGMVKDSSLSWDG